MTLAVAWLAMFFLVSAPVHECMHAVAAWRLGDRTAKLFGRVSLDPITHFDPIGGGLLIISTVVGLLTGRIGGLGWAKPTPVNPINLRGRYADSIVAAAGPISNLFLAGLFAIGYRIMVGNGNYPMNDNVGDLITLVFWVGIQLNVLLMVFNLIPVPPLDGSHVLLDVLDSRTSRDVANFLNQYGLMLLFVVILFAGPLISQVSNPIVDFLAGN